MFDWLKDSWQFMLQHRVPMLIIIIPLALIQNYIIPWDNLSSGQENQNQVDSLSAFIFEYWPNFALMSLLGLLQNVLLILTMSQLLSGQGFSFAKVFSRALVVFVPVLLLAILSTLSMSLGLLLLIVPGIYIMLKLMLAPYFMLVDGARLFASISQSWRFSKGYIGELLGGLVIISILASLPTWFHVNEGEDFSLINNLLDMVSAIISASFVVYLYRVFDYAKANPRN